MGVLDRSEAGAAMEEEAEVLSLTEYAHRQLQAQLDQGKYTDVVVVVSAVDAKGKTKIEMVKGHKLVLAAWSPVLRELIDEAINNCHPQWIRLCECDPEALRQLMRTFYTGQLALTVGSVWRTRTVAVRLGVKPVVNLCDRYLRRHANIKTCVKWLNEASRHGTDDQREALLQLALRAFNAIKDTPEFLEIDYSALLALLESHKLQTLSEYSVLLAALRWVAHCSISRKELLPDILSRIRFNLMGKEEHWRLVSGKHEYRFFLRNVEKFLLSAMARGAGDIPRRSVIKWGIQSDVSINDIRECGWKLAYGQPYRTATSLKELEAIKGDYLLVGACKKGTHKMAVCAMGRRDRVLNCHGGWNQVTFENGAYWFCCADRAFGFAPTWKVEVSAGKDVADAKRLSWHLRDSRGCVTERGGIRAGWGSGNGASEWMKLIFSLSV